MMTAAMTSLDSENSMPPPLRKTVTDGLAAHGFEVRAPASEKCCFLKVMNVPSTMADLTIWRYGSADWEYHTYDGSPRSLTRLSTVTLAILAGHDAPAHPAGTGHPELLTGIDDIGRTAREHGLTVISGPIDPGDDSPGTCSEITITHPDRPHRGTVRIVEDGGLWWRCQVRDQPGDADGLELTEIAATIGRALTSAGTI